MIRTTVSHYKILEKLGGGGMGAESLLRYFSLFSIQLLLAGAGIFGLPPAVCFSQSISWQRTNGPYGGRIFLVAATPQGTLLAGAENCGIFRSTDDGETWRQTSLTYETAVSFVADPRGRLLVGTYSASGVFVSSDDGLTWSKSNAGLNQDGALSLAISSRSMIFAGTFYHGVFKSTDGGSQWTQQQLPISGEGVYPVWSMCADSVGNVYAGVAGKGLFRSSDGGETWVLVGFQTVEVHSLICPSPGEILAGAGYGIYRSTDKGATWGQLGVNIPNVNSIASNSSGQIFAFTDGGVFRSVDGGLSWMDLDVGFGPTLGLGTTRFLSGSVSSRDYIFAGSDGQGIDRSTDNGAVWNEANTGLTGNSVWDLVSTHGSILLAGTDRGLFVTRDNGETWINTHALPAPVSSLVVVSGKTVFAATSAGVYRSNDEGMNWQRVDKGFQWTYMISICTDSMNGVYAATSGRQIYRSTDSGDTWTLAIELGHSVYTLASSAQGEVYAGTFLGGIYRSTDRGVTWSEANNGVPELFGDRTIVSISVLRVGDLLASSPYGQLLRSTDKGNSWRTIVDSAGSVRSVIQDGNGLIYAGVGNRVLCSSNQGTSWFDAGSGPGNAQARTLVIDQDGYLFAGLTYGGVFRSTRNIPTVPPSHYQLSQNYPNPFNSSTIIGFSVLEFQRIELKVYNLIGQELATLIAGQLGPGNYEVRWVASTASSGIYFYRLQAGDASTGSTSSPQASSARGFVETKKMILLR